MTDSKTLKVIKEQIETVEGILKDLRAEFDRTDGGNPYSQAIAAQNITIAAAKLDTLCHLYKILGGV